MFFVLALLLAVLLIITCFVLVGASLYSVVSTLDSWSLRYANRSATDMRYVSASNSMLSTAVVALPVAVLGAIMVFFMHTKKR
jgi:uncharacterized membrane protein